MLIIWRYDTLRFARSRRLQGLLGVSCLLLALIYIVPLLSDERYHGVVENANISVFSIESLGIAPWEVHYSSVAPLMDNGIEYDTLKLLVDGADYPSGPFTWTLAEEEDFVPTQVEDAPTVILFTGNVTDRLVTASYSWAMSSQGFCMNFLSFVSLLVVLSAVFLGADSLAGEFQNKTGYLVFPNPLKRSVLYLGRFLASYAIGMTVLTTYYCGVAILSFVTLNKVDDDFAFSFLFASQYLTVAAAIAYAASAGLKGTTGTAVFVFMLLVVVLPAVDGFTVVVGERTEASLAYSSSIITSILFDPYNVDIVDGFGGFPDPNLAAISMLTYTSLALSLGVLLFERRQFMQ
jgi:ABC-2 type transport system permease protein